VRIFQLFEAASLPMDPESRFRRAEELGFTVKAFHGTGADFHSFSLAKGKPARGGGYAPMFSNVPGEAGGYANKIKGHVLPVLLRMQRPMEISHLKKPGMDKLLAGVPSRWDDGAKSTRDVMDSVWKYWFDKLGDQKKAWTEVYRHFAALGYDSFVFADIERDYPDGATDSLHTKFVIFDPKNVRSIFAAFDPSKANSANLLA
jgi:hypothetical protein